MPWPKTKGKETHLTDPNREKCRVSSCYISYHREDFSKSDAVVFHGSAMPTNRRLSSILWRKPKGQKWAWYSAENPETIGSYSYIKSMNDMFDITITYRRDSTVFEPYGYYKVIQSSPNSEEVIQQVHNMNAKKDRLLLWHVSNCDPLLRLSLVKAIAKYIHVDVYGRCQKYFNQRGVCGRWSQSCDTWSKRYKFYLAFENYNCKDYVTEKYWNNALARNVVPVVVAGSYNKDIMIPGSYIDILDFPNAESLAKYLIYLDSNKTAYDEYFEWKKKYTVVPESNWLCDLCETLHQNSSGSQRLWDLGKFWGTEHCHADDLYIENVWLKSSGTNSKYWTTIILAFHLLIQFAIEC
ncbi:hypothetical protein QZH41_003959 [Actinostola sp. cb2023]|nr:hypothetical protein QZH41_003959 [Actinostola sp. cb2023]